MFADITLVIANIALIITVILLREQHKLKNKIQSVNLSKDTLKTIKSNPKLKDINNKINRGEGKEYDEKTLEIYLNEYEDLAMYWDDKLVKIKHIKETHGAILRKIKHDEFIQDFIIKKTKEDKTNYTSISKLLKKL